MHSTTRCLFLILLIKLVSADMKSCSEKHDKLEVCVEGKEGYKIPFPVLIGSDLYLLEIIDIDEEKHSVSIQVDLWTYWKDPLLASSNNSANWWFEIVGDIANEVWHPIIEFGNLIHYEKKEVYGGTKPFIFWYAGNVNPDITVVYGEGLQLTFSCKFEFNDFPFDSHECPMEYGDKKYQSFNLKMNSSHVIHGNLSNRIGEHPIILNNLPFPYDFELRSMPAHEISNSYGMTYSFTGMLLTIKRKSYGQLLSGYYYPTASFALLSMISFLIKPDKVPGRMGMILMLYLISTNVYNSVEAPTNRGFSYIEVWQLGTQFPILLAFFEYGFVLLWKKRLLYLDLQNQAVNYDDPKPHLDRKIIKVDYATMLSSFTFFLSFVSIYFCIALFK